MAILEVKELKVYFHTRNGVVKAVDNVSFSVDSGKTLAIVKSIPVARRNLYAARGRTTDFLRRCLLHA